MKLNFFPIKLTNDRGVFIVNIESGWGEISPLTMTGLEYNKIKAVLLKLQEDLKTITRVEPVEACSNLFESSLTPAIKCGIEQSLLHHQANMAGKSLAELLCQTPKPQNTVKINALIPRISPPEALKMTEDFLRQGYTSIKIKVGSPDIKEDIDRVKAVRKRSGQTINIHLDANGRWHKDNVIENLSLLSDFKIDYIEQPLSTLVELAWLKDRSPIPLAVDEAVTSLAQLREAMELDCCHFVVIKPMLWGGILAAQKGIDAALSRGLPVILTGTLEGTIGRWGVYELGRACFIDRACGLTGFDYSLDFFAKPL